MLTRKQLELLDFIHSRTRREGVPPSFDEMKDALNLKSKSGIHRLITALEERGYIRRLPHKARALEIVKMPESLGCEAVGSATGAGFVPTVIDNPTPTPKPAPPLAAFQPQTDGLTQMNLVGRIAAGGPIEAIEDTRPQVDVPRSMLARSGKHYALEVKGDSMIEAGINDGDIVVIREQETAENGEIVVALIGGQEATLKRLRKGGGAIALEAANPLYETRVYRTDQVAIRGKLVGLIRSY